MYQALYRKWRPRVFADVVGQEHITRTLRNQVSAGKTGHAYLFTGSRGTGKTTCSKILAKAVNCLSPTPDGDPCGECAVCKGIDEGSVLDVVEIDAASNNGVENIRDLREEANFTPAAARFRVYIIDETHMLSIGAFNALLKIMEEPPPHVLFILATTEVHKVPATILSRCQRFDFRRIPPDVIARRLAYIAKQEGVALEEDAGVLIARLSDGGMRDALSLLDVCISRSSHVELETVSQAAGLARNEYLFSIAQSVQAGDTGAALASLEALSERSVEFDRLTEQLVGHYRNLMVARTVTKPEEMIVCLPDELEKLQVQSREYRLSAILFAIDCLSQALTRMSQGSSKRVELEMALVRLCNPSLDGSQAAVLSRLEALEDMVRSGAVPQQISSAASPPPAQTVPSKEKALSTPEEVPVVQDVREEDLEKVTALACWPEVLEKREKMSTPRWGALNGSTAYVSRDLCLIDAPNQLFLELIRSSSTYKNCLREALRLLTNQKYRLGPYNKEKYQIVDKLDPLEELLDHAASLGIEVEIKE